MHVTTCKRSYSNPTEYGKSKEYKQWLKENMQDEVKAILSSISKGVHM